MNMKPLLLVLVTLVADGVLAQTLTIRRDDLNVNVDVRVIFTEASYYQYHYTFQNEKNSRQSMVRAVLELGDEWGEDGGTIKNVSPPKEKDWGEFPTLGRTMRWNASYDTSGIDVLEKPPRSAVLPGEDLTFQFESKGLPSIGNFWAAGWAPWYFTAEETDSLLRLGYSESGIMDLDENALRGTTVVPRVLQGEFHTLSYLDTVLSYTRRSVDLGWLGTGRDDDCDNDEHPQDGIERNIERRLTMAQRDLQRGDSVKARKDLEMLVNKVDRIWKRGQMTEKKHEHDRGDWWQHRKDWVVMTSEAYALLKYNTEYLIDRLPEGERHGGREKK